MINFSIFKLREKYMFGEKLPLSNIAFECYKKCILVEKLFVCVMWVFVCHETNSYSALWI